MIAAQDIAALLNTVLKTTLTGINQYFLHARMLKAMGEMSLADSEYRSSIEIMKHSDMLVEHMLALKHAPNLQELGRLRIGQDVRTMLENDCFLAETLLAQATDAATASEGSTAALLHVIARGQQERLELIRTQLSLLSPSAKKDVA